MEVRVLFWAIHPNISTFVNFKKYLLFFCLLLSLKLFGFQTTAKQLFLSPPTLLNPANQIELLKNRTLDMTLGLGVKDHFRFVTTANDIYYEIIFYDQIPECLHEKTKKLFIQDNHKENRYIHTYCYVHPKQIKINEINENYTWKKGLDYNYVAAERRILKNQHPKTISLAKLKKIFKKKTTLIYTGAGISAASGVPTMHQLVQLMNLGAREGFIESLDQLLDNPEKLIRIIYAFHTACFESKPTKAHWALARLVKSKQTQLLTENLDFLQEATGVIPYRPNGDYLSKQVDPASLREIDYIICIGLSFDDKGFLGWYKKNHPKGKIISIDLISPSYLGDEDYFLKGDLQKIVPKM